MNITKLKVWNDLVKLGFVPITYSFNGKVVTTGASLRKKLVDISGKEFYTDIITIEPHSYQYSNKRYHISGKVNTPFPTTLYQYEYGVKQPIYRMCDTINGHYSAAEILQTVLLMLK